MKNLNIALMLFLKKSENGDFKLFLQKRAAKDFLKDKLELPGGKIEKSETGIDSIIREIKEECEFTLSNSRIINFDKFFYKYQNLDFEHCFECFGYFLDQIEENQLKKSGAFYIIKDLLEDTKYQELLPAATFFLLENINLEHY